MKSDARRQHLCRKPEAQLTIEIPRGCRTWDGKEALKVPFLALHATRLEKGAGGFGRQVAVRGRFFFEGKKARPGPDTRAAGGDRPSRSPAEPFAVSSLRVDYFPPRRIFDLRFRNSDRPCSPHPAACSLFFGQVHCRQIYRRSRSVL